MTVICHVQQMYNNNIDCTESIAENVVAALVHSGPHWKNFIGCQSQATHQGELQEKS